MVTMKEKQYSRIKNRHFLFGDIVLVTQSCRAGCELALPSSLSLSFALSPLSPNLNMSTLFCLVLSLFLTVGVNVGPSVWTERPSSSDSSDGSSIHSHSPDPEVEYTEVVHPQPVDPARVPLKKGTDTVYSELQTAPLDPSEHVDNGAVEYAELNHDLPEPVD